MPHVAILRGDKLPSFVTQEMSNLDALFEDDDLLIRGFEAQGLQASAIVWSDPNVDWDRFDAALIRSTYDYLDEQERFLQILSQIESSSCRLYNPLAAVRWNMDKRYLLELGEWGVPVVPTYLVSDLEGDALREMAVRRQWQTLILKPTVGLGASHSYRVPLVELDDRIAELKASEPRHEYLLQPFVQTVVTEGEWSFVYFNRQFSHALLKKPAAGDYRVQGVYGGTIEPVEPRTGDRWQAEAVMAKLPYDLLYTRIDLVRVEGQLAVIEVELIEPIFSFSLVPEGVARLVNATRSRLNMHQ